MSKTNRKEKERSNKNKKEKKRSKYTKTKNKKKKEKKKTYKNHSSQAKINKNQNTKSDNSSLITNSTKLRKRLICSCDTPNEVAVKKFTQNRRFYDKFNFLANKLDKISIFKSYASLLGKITKNGTICTKAAKVDRRFVILHKTFFRLKQEPKVYLREHFYGII